MAQPVVSRSPGLGRRAAFETKRRDAWWAPPLVIFVVFSAFVVYATWAAFQGEHYRFGPYLSPFYSPELFGDAAQLVRPQARLVAGLAAVLAGAPHPLGAGRLPPHLLLLPRRLLQGVLGRSARLRRGRAAQELPRRGVVPADPAERPPLLPLPGAALPRLPGARRLEGALVHRPRDRRDVVRHRRRHAGAGGQRRAARRLHLRLPLAAPPGRRQARPARRRRRLRTTAYDCVELPQPPPHALGLDEPRSGSPSPTSTCGCARWAIWTDWRIL